MRQIRYGVFETNSSSTHSIVICTEKEYKQFQNDELMYDGYNEELVPYSDLLLKAEYYRYKGYSVFGHDLETYYRNFTTPSGDKMVAFGEYGYD